MDSRPVACLTAIGMTLSAAACGRQLDATPTTATEAAAPAPARVVCPAPAETAVAAMLPVTASGPYQQGDLVELRFQGAWYPAIVRETLRADLWLVSYDGYGRDWDLAVGPDRLRPRRVDEQTGAAVVPGTTVASAVELQAGQAVLVLYGSAWYPGTVRHVTQQGMVRIGYDGYAESWDETVGLERLRVGLR